MKRKRQDKEKTEHLNISDVTDLLKPEWFKLPDHISSVSSLRKLRHISKSKTTNDQNRVKLNAYVESKKETENLRKQLLKLINDEKPISDSFEIPNKEEKNLIKYYYYIHQGVDIVNIAPLEKVWIENILSRIQPKLKLEQNLMDKILSEVQNDFLFSVKKSVIDFTLDNSKDHVSSVNENKNDLNEIKKKKRQFETIKLKIKNNLFKIHPTIVKISQLWSLQYRNVRIINMNELYSYNAIDLNQFSEWISSQTELCQNIILEKWIPSVFKILSNVLEKKSFITIKKKKIKKFYECLSTLMTLQLQSLCLKTMKEYTNFICNVNKSPGFQVHLLYKNNKILFNPSYREFENKFVNVLSNLTTAVSYISRIETKLYMKNYENPDNQYLKPRILEEIIKKCRSEIEETLQNEWICPELKIQDFDQYACLINGQSKIEVNKFLSEERQFSMFKEKVDYYHELGIEISLFSSRVETIGIFELHREHFISILINKSQATKDRFLLKITDTYQEACKRLNGEFQIIKDTLLEPLINTAELVKLKEYCLKLGTEILFEMEDRLREVMSYILFCSDYVPLTSAQIKQNSITFLCYRRINGILEENRNIIKEKTKLFQELLLNRIELFKQNLEKYQTEVDEFQNYRDASELSKYLKKAQSLHKKFSWAEERIREFNEEEVAFGWMTSSYAKRDELVNKLAPYKKLYENCADYKNKYQMWTEAKVGTIEPDDIEKDVETFHNNIIELCKEFSSSPAPYALTNSIKQDVEQFQKHMPIVKTLGNPCLKDRHWEKISEIVGFPLRTDDDLTLAKILDYGLEEYVSKFQIISDSATKESNLEIRLNGMIAEWKDIKFEITPYRDSGTFILTTAEEIQILLDDHIVKTQTMKNSPYIKPFENALHSWEEKLILLQEIIDSWLSVQKTWLYLEPIFTFSDTQHLIPEESKRFSAVDKTWKDIMKAASSNTSVLIVINIEKMLERLGKCKTLLNLIQNGLDSYLETKRLSFPRFFFLSNKEILSIISNTRDPSGVQPFLKKCFTGIHKLRFNANDDIIGIISDIEEELPLNEEIDTGSRRGQVEKWFADLERIMKSSVKQEIMRALAEYEMNSYKEWIFSYSQQVCCLVSAVTVTTELSRRLSNVELLREFLEKLIIKIDEMIKIVSERLHMKKRYILVSLLIYFTYIRDSIRQLIEKSDLERKTEYIMHLRHYEKNGDVTLSMINSSIDYGYEYVGNYFPLITTPFTDACYKSFFIAFKYNYGMYVEGPTGVGKTEVIKDFARATGKYCVVFSCLKKMDYTLIEKIFMGIVSSSVWICFDNLDVLQLEVLKIIEHYIVCIQQAIKFGDYNVKFKDGNIKMQHNHLVFTTVNLKNSDSQFTLPPFLKTVFRGVSFDQVNCRNILEKKFLTMGFIEHQLLAEKLETICRIGTELFRFQSYIHYDIRLFNRILIRAEVFKQKHRNWNEQNIVVYAIESVCRCIFSAEDWFLFKKIVNNVLKNQGSMFLDESLTTVIREACTMNNAIFDGNIYEKVEQLSNAMKLTAGIILVGDTFSGKSTILKILVSSLKLLSKNSEGEMDIETVVINPKSVTLKQLFGHQDQSTSKWVDGILTSYYRQFSESKNKNRKWLIFDGPMDTTWLDDLSTVLDDSKKLYLESGETIPLASEIKIIFETSNLNHVSPLTISRCCIITLNSSLMKWEYLISSWLKDLPHLLAEQQKQYINSMALRFCRPLFHFIDSVAQNLLYSVTRNHMIKSLCNIFDCFMDDYRNYVYMQTTAEIDIRSQLEGIFFFSCIWSLGALLSKSDKVNFDILFRALLCKEFPADIRHQFSLPEEFCRSPVKQYVYTIPDFGTVYDYQYIREGKGKWKLWSENAASTSAIPRELQFRQIIVPTKTTIRNHHLISLLAYHQKNIMFIGDTASGKTVDISHFLNTKLDSNSYKPIFLNFTTGTTGNCLQHLINCKLDKRKKGVYGPPLGKRYVLFIDDINAATKNQYGVISAVELLRHLIEFSQWYNLDNASVVQLIDLQLLCAFTTKLDDGKSLLCSRFTKFVNIFSNDDFDDETLKSIFSKIMLWHLDTRGFSKEFDPCIDQVVDATLAIHRLVQINLLPVPEKSHYIFNLRDFSKIIQGVVLSVPEAIEDLLAMKRLWVHEVIRIYHDRIIDQCDSDWFMDNLRSVTSNQLKENLDILLQHLTNNQEPQVNQGHLKKLIFCDFINPKADVRNYAEVQDMDTLQSIVESYLIEYNNVNKKPMNLLLFTYAIEHISRICRILKQPQGHALLLGEYGTGKQSLARLAIHMCEYELYEIELSSKYNEDDWRKDMKSLLCSVYSEQQSAFLFTNVHKMPLFMLENISDLLKYAEIRELFTSEDKKEIYEKMEIIDNQRDKALQTDGSHEALFNLFLQRIKKQIHVVVVVNSSLSDFRKYIYKYPSFTTCCTIDWFEPWPKETQNIVARKLMLSSKCKYQDLDLIIELCDRLHCCAKIFSSDLALKADIDINFTQRSFIHLITTFRDLFAKKIEEQSCLKKLYKKAIQHVASIKEQIPILDYDYKTLQPTIKEKRTQVEQLEIIIEAEKETEAEAEVITNGAKTVVNNCEKKLNQRKREYENKIKEIKDIRESVTEHLQMLTTNDIAVLKSMKSPPKAVKLVAEALVHIKEIKPEKVQESGKTVEDFWKPAIKLINDSKFIEYLISFDMSNVSPRILRLLEDKILPNEEFDADKIKSYSVAAEAIYKWILVVYEYNKLTKMDSDVRIKLTETEEEYMAVKTDAILKEKNLEAIVIKRQNLLHRLDENKNELSEMEKREATCYKKKLRACELVEILENKINHWLNKTQVIEERNKTLTGDILLCAAVISYLTSLSQEFRNDKIKEWQSMINSSGLECNSQFSFCECLLDELDLEKERLSNLLEDEFVYDNLAILRYSTRYPLIIDPQEVMNTWINLTETENGLVITRPDNLDYLRKLENAVSSGIPILLENVNEILDPILYSVFEKNSYRASGGVYIKLGKNSIEYNSNFRLYLTTKLPNPHFSLEIHEKLAIINSSMTKTGTENFFLKTLIKSDRPDLEATRYQLTCEFIGLKKIITDSEMRILQILAKEKDILEEETKVNCITTDAVLVDDNMKKISDINSQLEMINTTIEQYHVNSKYLAGLFEIAGKLLKLNTTYQISIKSFGSLITNTVHQLQKVENSEKRLKLLSEMFLHNFYSTVSHCLTTRDRLIFGYLLSLYSIQQEHQTEEELAFFIDKLREYDIWSKEQNISPLENLLERANRISRLRNFKTLEDVIMVNKNNWEKALREESVLPDSWENRLNNFQKLILKTFLYSEEIITHIRTFVKSTGIEDEEKTVLHDLDTIYKKSTCCVPIAVITFDSCDPIKNLLGIAVSLGIPSEKCYVITLNQYDNCFKTNLLDLVKSVGSWIIIRNLQNAKKCFGEIEKIFEVLTPNTVHPDFRLWFILQADIYCPEFILQNCFIAAYDSFTGVDLKSFKKEHHNQFKFKDSSGKYIHISEELLFNNLAMFHTTLLQSIHTLQWNKDQLFNDMDFEIAFYEICSFIRQFENEFHLEGIIKVISDCSYGINVGNEWDLRYMKTILRSFWNEHILAERNYFFLNDFSIENCFSYCSSNTYWADESMKKLLLRKETKIFIRKLLTVQGMPEDAKSDTVNLIKKIENINDSIPETFMNKVYERDKLSTDARVFLNRAVANEIEFFNAVILSVRKQLMLLKKSLQGYCHLTEDLEALQYHIENDTILIRCQIRQFTVPCYILDLDCFINVISLKRSFLQKWFENDFKEQNLSVLEYPRQFFIFNILQHCLKDGVPVNEINIDFYVIPDDISKTKLYKTFINGLVLQNAVWNKSLRKLDKCDLEKSHEMSMLCIAPQHKMYVINGDFTYTCPIYKNRIIWKTGQAKREIIVAVSLPATIPPNELIKRRVELITNYSI